MNPLENPLDISAEATDFGSIRYEGLLNPSPVPERTLINRSEAYLMLQGHEIRLNIPKGKKDPFLQVVPKVEFKYMTEADIDPRTGMPRIVKKKGVEKIIRSRIDKFSIEMPTLFSKTSKMKAPSWSFPAGPPAVGGTCISSALFKHPSQYETALAQGDVQQRPANVKDWICSYCYAGKSNYMHRTSQYSQTIRAIWMMGILKTHSFPDAAKLLTKALRAHLGNKGKREADNEDPRYFRIHDSGDMTLNPDTYSLWCSVAGNLGDVSFWAPTRMWTFASFVNRVRSSPPPGNLVLRPSALHFNDKAPAIEGFAAGSTAHASNKKQPVDPVASRLADWSCPAYQFNNTCSGSKGPDKKKPCRLCWDYPDSTVSYKGH